VAATGILGLVMLGLAARFHPLAPFVVSEKREAEYDEGEDGEDEVHRGRDLGNEGTRGRGDKETRDQEFGIRHEITDGLFMRFDSGGRIACGGCDAPVGRARRGRGGGG
jgi:hypothetical protein